MYDRHHVGLKDVVGIEYTYLVAAASTDEGVVKVVLHGKLGQPDKTTYCVWGGNECLVETDNLGKALDIFNQWPNQG